MNTRNCITDADLTRLWEDDLSPQQKEAIQQHLLSCTECQTRWEQMSAGARHIDKLFGKHRTLPERKSFESFSQEADQLQEVYRGETWWQEYVTQQILGLLVRVPEEMERLLDAVGIMTAKSSGSDSTIKLSLLEPSQSAPQRLAAATGEGFEDQILQQDDPPFEFHLGRFGNQTRIEAQALAEDPSDQECLARLQFCEGETVLLSRYVLLKEGKVRVDFTAEEIVHIRPQQKGLLIRLDPVRNLDQLDGIGSDIYLPILTRLMQNDNAEIRKGAVEVLARIQGPGAAAIIKPLAGDPDERVRLAVQKALNLFPDIQDEQE